MPSPPAARAAPIGPTTSRAAASNRPSTPSRRPRITVDRVDPAIGVPSASLVPCILTPDAAEGRVVPRDWWSCRSVTSAAAVRRAQGALRLTVVLALAQGVALVVLLLAGRDRDLHLGASVLEVQRQRHDRASALARLVGDLLELGAVQEQLALAARGVVVPGAVEVLGDVHVLEIELVAGEHREA